MDRRALLSLTPALMIGPSAPLIGDVHVTANELNFEGIPSYEALHIDAPSSDDRREYDFYARGLLWVALEGAWIDLFDALLSVSIALSHSAHNLESLRSHAIGELPSVTPRTADRFWGLPSKEYLLALHGLMRLPRPFNLADARKSIRFDTEIDHLLSSLLVMRAVNMFVAEENSLRDGRSWSFRYGKSTLLTADDLPYERCLEHIGELETFCDQAREFLQNRICNALNRGLVHSAST